MSIEIKLDEDTNTFTIKCNGENIFECLGWDEVLETKISDIYHFYKDEV